MTPLSVALLHHPVLDQGGQVVTSAITNLDLHDIARSCRTYGVASYFVVHPVPAQRALAERIVGHWEKDGRHDFRRQALELVRVVPALADAVAALTAEHGRAPTVLATTARARPGQIGYAEARALPGPVLLLLGTGFGLTDAALDETHHVLAPLQGPSDYKHLSVRSACAILLDRLLGIEKTAALSEHS